MSFFQMPSPLAARRLFLGRTGLTLSGAAVALLAGNEALATKAGGAGAQDVQILNTALGAELEAIAAYQLGLTVRIEINLPPSGDQATYDAIFKSIRANLLNGNGSSV